MPKVDTPRAACATEGCKEAREWISSCVTFLVILAGLAQYWRAQQWKRAEFLAGEMKDFFGDKKIQNALTMMDWARRKIDLFNEEEPDKWPIVTRKMQTRALYLHTLTEKMTDEADTEYEDGASQSDLDLVAFSRAEAAIRDCYDTFLDGLERLSSYLTTGLVARRDLNPYLAYWMEEIPREGNAADNDWTCMLLSYITFYNYSGVQKLFRAFGSDISYGSPLFEFYLGHLRDSTVRAKLRSELRKELRRRADKQAQGPQAH